MRGSTSRIGPMRITTLSGAALLVLGMFAANPLVAQRSEIVQRSSKDSAASQYRVHHPVGQPRALLVLIPGYGGGVDSFQPESGYTPSALPALLARHGILSIIAAPDPQTLFVEDEPLRRLDDLVAEVLQRHSIPAERVVIGGFSSGGTGAVRYAQHCRQERCRATTALAGVFAVDAPLDLERLYLGDRVSLARAAPRTNRAEAEWIIAHLEQALGGSPGDAPDAYRRQSALLASLPDGGNASLLVATPLRLYTEPDVAWWMENRNLDYAAMNSVDHAALINILNILGNQRAELITTSGRGYRPDGTRHPHSWSIVDEDELAGWIVSLVGGP